MNDRSRARALRPGACALLLAYVAIVYLTLPYGPALGRVVTGNSLGAWLLGPGMGVIATVAGGVLVIVLLRRRAPVHSYLALALAAVGYGLALSWLRAQHLERVHLPEYGLAAWLAWRVVEPLVPGWGSYPAAALLAAAVGWGDELVQAITPGRFYDIRDVAANALGAALGALVLAALRAQRGRVSDGSSARR